MPRRGGYLPGRGRHREGCRHAGAYVCVDRVDDDAPDTRHVWIDGAYAGVFFAEMTDQMVIAFHRDHERRRRLEAEAQEWVRAQMESARRSDPDWQALLQLGRRAEVESRGG